MKTHQLSSTKEYKSWIKMRERCNDINNNRYQSHGNRGITVCERWQNSFENFLEDMGPKPSPQHSIDRIDNNGNYEPNNCRWATNKEQANNRRTNRNITINNETKTLAEWCEYYSLTYSTVRSRFYTYKWPIEKALEIT